MAEVKAPSTPSSALRAWISSSAAFFRWNQKPYDVVVTGAVAVSDSPVVDDAMVSTSSYTQCCCVSFVLEGEESFGRFAVQLAAGQVVTVILPVGQTHRAVDLEQGKASLFSISLIR